MIKSRAFDTGGGGDLAVSNLLLHLSQVLYLNLHVCGKDIITAL